MNSSLNPAFRWHLFRLALFAAAASLAGYIVYKYATQFHATQGLYAFIFPFSSVLAAAGIVLAVKPEKACDCSGGVRAGVGLLAGLWLVVGLACVPALAEAIAKHPAGGLFATFQMLAQHVFLSLTIIAFAFAPRATARNLGVPAAVRAAPGAGTTAGALSGS